MCFADNFRECATLNAFYEEIFKLPFFIELYCANINPENFHLRITLLNKILKSLKHIQINKKSNLQ